MARVLSDTGDKRLEHSGAIVAALPFSVSLWIYCTDNSADRVLFWTGADGSTIGFSDISTRADGTIRFRQGTGDYAATGNVIQTNEWHHVVGVWESSSSRYGYYDGANKATDVGAAAVATFDIVRIGGYRNGGFVFEGRVCEVALWEGIALDDLEASFLYQGMPPWEIRRAHLVGLWLPFADWSDRDFSGRGYHMTPVNAPTWDFPEPPQVIRPWRSNPQYMGRRVVGREQPGGVWARPWGIAPVTAVAAGKLVDSIRLKSLVHGGLT